MNNCLGVYEEKLIPLVDIDDNPYQSRNEYSQAELIVLAASIKDVGLLQVPIARQVGNRFELAFGHRRKRAFEILSHSTMPLHVMDLTDREMFEISVTENLKRQDLNPIERATMLKRYLDGFHASSTQAAKLFGISASHIRGLIRLLKLPEGAQNALRSGNMSQGQARIVLSNKSHINKTNKPRKTYEFHAEITQGNLRLKLIKLVYGEYKSGITDDMLFRAIERVFNIVRQPQS